MPKHGTQRQMWPPTRLLPWTPPWRPQTRDRVARGRGPPQNRPRRAPTPSPPSSHRRAIAPIATPTQTKNATPRQGTQGGPPCEHRQRSSPVPLLHRRCGGPHAAVGNENPLLHGDDPPYVFAKTGTLRHKHCLSGYLRTHSGRVLIFSFMHNNYTGSSARIKEEMQRVLEMVQGFE